VDVAGAGSSRPDGERLRTPTVTQATGITGESYSGARIEKSAILEPEFSIFDPNHRDARRNWANSPQYDGAEGEGQLMTRRRRSGLFERAAPPPTGLRTSLSSERERVQKALEVSSISTPLQFTGEGVARGSERG
jgi:hypothetical protein